MTVYIYDSKEKRLSIVSLGIGMVTEEELVEYIAKEEGMAWENVSWGYVDSLTMELDCLGS